YQLARRDALGGNARRKPLQVAYPLQNRTGFLAHAVIRPETLHHIEPAVEPRDILYRQRYPLLEQPAAHRRDRPVDDVRETAPFAHRIGRKEFEVAYREAVYPYVPVFVDARDAGNVAHVLVLRKIEI